jgi:hypothetical protein
MPPLGAVINSGVAVPDSWFQIDVTGYITGDGIFSIALETPVSVLGKITSSEGGANMPVLEITLSIGNDPDISGDGGVDYGDFAVISAHFMEGCAAPGWCGGADLDISGAVDPNDVRIFAESWVGLP